MQSVGHIVELAGSQVRAFELAAGKKIEVAIVVHSGDFNGLEKELRDQFQGRSCWAIERTRSVDRGIHFVEQTHCLRKHWTSRSFSISSEPPMALPGAGQANGSTPVILTIEDCQLDLAAHTFVDGNGQEVQLTRAEIALLTAFAGSPRRVLSRDQLRRAIGGRGADPTIEASTCLSPGCDAR